MIRRGRFNDLGIVLLCALVIAILVQMLIAASYQSQATMDMWGRAILSRQGLINFEKSASTYPPIAQIGMNLLAWLLPGTEVLAPLLLSAMLAMVLTTVWYVSLHSAGYSTSVAALVTLGLELNPLFFRAVAEGPGSVLLLFGIWILASGMFGFRLGMRVNDIILISIGLVLLVFADPFGWVLALAAVPFLALAAPPDLLLRASGGVFLVLLFPLVFCLASFLYANWALTGEPLQFATSFARETMTGNGTSGGLQAGPGVLALLVLGLLVCCPIAIAMLVQVQRHRRRPLGSVLVALLGTLIAAIELGALLEILPAPSLVLGLTLPLTAACAVAWRRVPRVHRPVSLLVFAGWVCALIAVAIDPSAETVRWRTAMLEGEAPPLDRELAGLAHALAGRQGVLFDAEAAPAVIAQRGSAAGIRTADTREFQLAALSRTVAEPVLVVRSAASIHGADRLDQIFPEISEKGLRDYNLVFAGPTWRVYAADNEVRQ